MGDLRAALSIEKLDDGTGYKVRWRDTAGRSRRKKVTLWRDAVRLDGEMKRKKAMGELIAHEKGTIRLCDFWELWLQNYAASNLSARTTASYKRLWESHLAPNLGSTTLRALSPEHCANVCATISKQLAPSSVRKVFAILQGVLQRAVEWGYIPTNPAQGVKRPKLVQRRGRALTHEQIEALCAELGHPRSAAIVRLLAYTGLRPGELRALRWTDFSPQLIRVEHAISGDTLGPTKTYKNRSVDLAPEARMVLLEWFVAQGQPAPQSFVFPGRLTDFWTDRGWNTWQQEVFAPAAEHAGLKGIVPYDLRHTRASRLIADGASVIEVARQFGHSPTVTLETYAHEFEQQRKSVPSECPANASVLDILRADGRSSSSG